MDRVPATSDAAPPDPARAPAPPAAPPWLTRRRAAVVLAVLALSALPGAWQNFTLYYLFHQADFGYCLQVSARLLGGEMPHRDFISIWPPLTHLLTVLSFRLFGLNFWAAKLPLALFVAATVPLTYRWLRPVLSRPAALAGAVAVWATFPVALRLPYATAFTLAPALVAFWQLGRMRPGRLWGPACWAGAACGIAIGIKHNVGIIIGLAIWARLLCLTPYAALAPGAAAATGRRLSTGVRLLATAVLLGSLGSFMAGFFISWPTALVNLAPAAALTVAGAYRAWRLDGDHAAGVAWRALGSATLLVAAAVVATTAPWIVWLAAHDALRPFLEQSLILRPEAGADWGRLYGMLLRLRAFRATTGMAAVALLCAIAAVRAPRSGWAWGWSGLAVALVVSALGIEGQLAGEAMISYAALGLLLALPLWWSPQPRVRHLAAMLTLGAWFVVLAYPASTSNHFATGLAPALAASVGLAWEWTRRRTRPARAAVLALVVCVVYVGWAQWAVAFTGSGPGERRWRLPARVPGARGGTWVPAHLAASYPAMAARLDALAPAGAPLVAWPSLGMVNFYTGRPNPTPMDLYWPGFLTPALERVILDELETAPPPVVVLNQAGDLVFGANLIWDHHPKLLAAVHDRYFSLGRQDTWEIFVRRPGAAPADGPPAPP